MQARLLFVHALSPLHAGTGQGVGVIDLPIAREKATGIPYLPGSSLKGVLRENCQGEDRIAIFGPEPKDVESDNNHASSVQFSDQRLLLLPIRSLKGTFAWVTSPYVLRRFAREIQDVGLTKVPPDIPQPEAAAAMVSSSNSALTLKPKDAESPLVILEDLNLTVTPKDTATDAWATWLAAHVFPDQADWNITLKERFCVVHDDVLSFLLTTATEIIARIKLQEHTKTVQQGQLWYEEALPCETILSGLVAATPPPKVQKTPQQVFDFVAALTQNTTLQLGGKATVGRGLCRIQMVPGGGNSNANA